MLDEVQTGMGRTGEWFGYQHYGIVPDLITLAKSLGGGVAIGALVATDEVGAALVPGTHASTFGGNCLASVAALATIETIRDDRLVEHARTLGTHLGTRLEAMAERFSFVKEVRRLGLMSALELDRAGAEIVRDCMERGLLINCTHQTVLRIVPATNVQQTVLDEGLAILEDVLAGQE
jgi:acetylornithine/succinyldiaminopimelate/putrescine aminotransferase